MPLKLLHQYKGFEAKLLYSDKQDPLELQIFDQNSKQPIIRIHYDAAECMLFSADFNLDDLIVDDALECLRRALKRSGGTFICAVSEKYVDKVREKLGLDIAPPRSSDPNLQWLNNVMYFKESGQQILNEKIIAYKGFENATALFNMIAEKNELAPLIPKISKFLLENSPWKNTEDPNSSLPYSEEALRRRLAQDNFSLAVATDKKTGEIVGTISIIECINSKGERIFNYPDNLIVIPPAQRFGLAYYLMLLSSKGITNTSALLGISAETTSDNAAVFFTETKPLRNFHKKLGSQKPSRKNQERITLKNGELVMLFGHTPPNEILINYRKTLTPPQTSEPKMSAIPSPTLSSTSPYAAFFSPEQSTNNKTPDTDGLKNEFVPSKL